MRLQKLVPTFPSDVGACDACRHGMGGVWLDALDPATAPIVWRYHFPPGILSALVTADNPTGNITISDLKLAGMIAHKDVLAHHRDVVERTLWVASNNRAAVAWSSQKGSGTSVAARAHLLRHLFISTYQLDHIYSCSPLTPPFLRIYSTIIFLLTLDTSVSTYLLYHNILAQARSLMPPGTF